MVKCKLCGHEAQKVLYYGLPGHLCNDKGCATFTGPAANRLLSWLPAKPTVPYIGTYTNHVKKCLRKMWARADFRIKGAM